VEHRTKSLGNQAREVAHAVRAARHQAHESAARHKAARGEVFRLPLNNLRYPIRHLRGALRAPVVPPDSNIWGTGGFGP